MLEILVLIPFMAIGYWLGARFCSSCAGRGGTPGIFMVFNVSAMQYVVRGDETAEELERMVEAGVTPVRVVPAIDWTRLERVRRQTELRLGGES